MSLLQDWFFSWKVKIKLRNQWLTDIDRDLIYASSKGFRETVSQLVSHASPQAKAHSLWQASYQGHSALQALLLENGAHPQAQLDGLLCRSASRGDIPTIQVALTRGADLHNNNDLALFLAGSNGHEEATHELLRLGASVHRAFNVYSISQCKKSDFNNTKAMDVVEWSFLNSSPPAKEKIGFKLPTCSERL